MSKLKLAKENETLRCILFDLVSAANRVSNKYGRDEQDNLSDWTEWVDLRISIDQAHIKGKIK